MSTRFLLIKSTGDGRPNINTEHHGFDINTSATQGDTFTRQSNGRFGEKAGGRDIVFLAAGAGSASWTNMPAAFTEFLGDAALPYRQIADLRGYSQFRIKCGIATAGVANSNIGFEYATTLTGQYKGLDNGTDDTQSTVTIPDLSVTGENHTAWTDLHSGAIAANIFLKPMGKDGDGAADPSFTYLILEVR